MSFHFDESSNVLASPRGWLRQLRVWVTIFSRGTMTSLLWALTFDMRGGRRA